MRPFLLVALVCAFVAGASGRALAAPPTSLDISAQTVDFFSNRYVLTADGGVKVRLSDGTIVRGDTFAMDLKLNRYLVAGNVSLEGADGTRQAGAAFAGFPDLDRSYFLPAAGTPDRWTFFGADWKDPHPGREQPGDAFYFPDLTGQRAYVVAKTATVIPRTDVVFGTAQVSEAGPYVPFPRFVVNFSSNSHFYENAFSGARFDIGVPFNGSAHSLSAIHVRNDAVNGTYLALDQHFVWDKDWVVASIDPLTQQQRQYNLIGVKWLGSNVQTHTFVQLSEAQAGIINAPTNAAGFGQFQLSAGLRRSGLSFTQNQYYGYLLGIRPDDTDIRHLAHPMDALLTWSGFENHVAGPATPLLFRLYSGYGWAHDWRGIVGYPNEPAPSTVSYRYARAQLYTPSLKLHGQLALQASYDRTRSWFSQPHVTDNAQSRATLSDTTRNGKVSTFLTYQITNVGDFWGAQQLQAYPARPDTVTTPFGTFSGLAAFRGFATQRQVVGGMVWVPSSAMTLNLSLTHENDTPRAVAGLYGLPPWQATGDLRLRISNQVQVDLSRSYYFNFANLRWTPQLGIQFSAP